MTGLYMLGVYLLSITSCFVIITLRMNYESKREKYKAIWGPVLLTLLFWCIHILTILSFGLPLSVNPITYFVSSLVMGGLMVWVVLHLAYSIFLTHVRFLMAVLAVSTYMFVSHYITSLFVYETFVDVKLLQLMMAFTLTLAYIYAGLRYLIELGRSESLKKIYIWKVLGSLLGGIVMAGIPYVTFLAIIETEDSFLGLRETSFIPYYIQIVFVFLLNLVPDLMREETVREQETRITDNQNNQQLLFDNHPEPVFVLSRDGIFEQVNEAFEQFTRRPKQQIIGNHFGDFMFGEVKRQFEQLFKSTIEGGAHHKELQIERQNTYKLDVMVTTIPVVVEGKTTGVYGIIKDVTEAKKVEATFQRYAYQDELTLLPNRRSFLNKLRNLEESTAPYAIMFIDMDSFKKLNDLFGHSFGDQIIQAFAGRIAKLLQGKHVFSRIAGDEFTVLIQEGLEEELLCQLAQDIIDSMKEPFYVAGKECYVTASIGIAMYPKHAGAASIVMKYADAAMYHAKKKGRNTFQIYNATIRENTEMQLTLENDLRRAISLGELTLHYQPKLHALSNEVIGLEALVRWKHPSLGMVPPGKFISIAEETGLIVALERWVMKEVCRQIIRFEQEGVVPPRIAFNLSTRHICQEDIVLFIQELLEQTWVNPNLLEIEITESLFMENTNQAIEKLQVLKDMGIRISMDDFGTGFSSLSYLKSLPLNCMKIDQSFVRDVTSDENSKAIVAMIISMANLLQFDVVAEGVETQEQLECLINLQCHQVQGYYFSKPLPIDEIQLFLQKAS
ncbi:EAL domain-containing protein [Ectobacillus antri]|jgi:diguanylate cyclase (GGDEF)-like protein/PAS domain S-box-containing protein|uniref:EAL domain-containing protein n=1 Tax=Ectobacillus antri TaxID=2486280 RepID=A0ABT6H7Y6_9BACI|nr:bifunctional diguanylate cyclase/phosphodiesterase [Ectobacillus antri]MDG4658419.1 EAL domain-containing protein [Ectobacillus antri]MDG5755444.1 EAL domain-containing protein [Ectobacillus antri]